MSAPPFEGYPTAVVRRFKTFHHVNSHIYRQFKKFAFQMKTTGRERYSARTIMEALRWHYDLRTVGDVFEINNDFTPLYVRLLIHEHPEFSNFFELRVVRSRGALSEEERRRHAA